MIEMNVQKQFLWEGNFSEKVVKVMKMFGLNKKRLIEGPVVHSCNFSFCQGDIVYITGPSGAGKSTLLNEIKNKLPKKQVISINQIILPKNKAVVDCVNESVIETLRMFSKVGLSDVFCLLNQPAKLSKGQQYRFKLAIALASGKKYIIADEFCSNLDDVTASVISFNVRKFADQKKVTFLLAGTRMAFAADLCPDVVISKNFSGKAEVIYKKNC